MNEEHFSVRHIGPSVQEEKEMLGTLGLSALDSLIDETVPAQIRLRQPLDMPSGLSEPAYLQQLKSAAALNKVWKSYIGLGYYGCHTTGF